MKTRTDLLNYLIERYKLKSYLEIGVQNRVNFDKIVCDIKHGVDPDGNADYVMTSDQFFDEYIDAFYDLIFIDGLHHSEQVKKDFNNALRCLNDKGFIVLHDCLPEKEETATHDRHTKQWYGTVWQFAMQLRGYSGIRFFTWNNDCGCAVIWKDETATSLPLFCGSTWIEYLQFRDMCLSITNDPESALP